MKFILVVMVLLGLAMAQDKPKFEPSDIQHLKLENIQLKAKLAQQSWSTKAYQLPEFTAANAALTALQQECTKVVQENKWPASVSCNVDTLQFYDTAPKKAEVKPEAKPEEKK
jgi:hypothetical protein